MDFSPLIKDGAIRVTEANRKALKKWVIDTYLNPKKQAFQSGNLSSTASSSSISFSKPFLKCGFAYAPQPFNTTFVALSLFSKSSISSCNTGVGFKSIFITFTLFSTKDN